MIERVMTVPSDVPRLGKAQIVPCPDCQGVAKRACYECEGRGSLLMRACPLCGDLGWDYINGTDDRDGMSCNLGCGYRWSADDACWRLQILPQQIRMTPEAAGSKE